MARGSHSAAVSLERSGLERSGLERSGLERSGLVVTSPLLLIQLASLLDLAAYSH